MATIEEVAEIRAEPEAVFDLIAPVATLSQYSAAITAIECIAPDVYRWHVRARGMTFAWESQVTERTRPSLLRWQSIKGVWNSGTIALEPCAAGTRVVVVMEYQLPTKLLERVVARLADPWIQRISNEILCGVRARLEAA